MEEIAYFINEFWADNKWLSYAFIAFGIVMALLSRQISTSMARSTYFLYISFLILIISSTALIWLVVPAAIDAGCLWLIVATVLSVLVFVGFAYAKATLARIQGLNSKWCLFFLIPGPNVFLFFGWSKDTQAHKGSSPLRGAVSVLTGIVLLVSAVTILVSANVQTDALLQAALQKPESEQVPYLIRTRGLNETLKILARNAKGPIQVDNVTTFSHVETRDNLMVRVLITTEKGLIPADLSTKIVRSICQRSALRALLESGAKIADRYVTKQGDLIVEVVALDRDCTN